jgi:D-serine deaminase-like pyridoxal phosphate-dependent protein
MDVETPALLLDLDAVERNIITMAKFFENRPCKLRPHFKTHKLPWIAHKQIEAGAIGITCSKLSEAKVLLESGIKEVLIANEVVGENKIKSLVRLSRLGHLIVCVDNYENAKTISEEAYREGRKIDILVEVDVGIHRCGVQPGNPTLELVKKVSELKGLQFIGLMGYEGGMFIYDQEEKKKKCLECNRLLVETKNLIEKEGFPVKIVSAGGSNTFYLTGLYPGITEVQAGSYVTMDLRNRLYGLEFEQALTVMATVISCPEFRRVVIDTGKKALSCDEGLPKCKENGLTLFKLNEEHGHVMINNSNLNISIGDKIEIIPSHGCTTIPLYDYYNGIRNEMVEAVFEIQARGASN